MEEIGVTNSQKLFVCNLSTVTSIILEIHVILIIFLFKRNETKIFWPTEYFISLNLRIPHRNVLVKDQERSN